jgi:hypothetical protein
MRFSRARLVLDRPHRQTAANAFTWGTRLASSPASFIVMLPPSE